MHKLLVISYGGFSPRSADGKTLEAILGGYKPNELSQFFCDSVEPDYSVCHSFFHITDSQMIKSFLKKGGSRVIEQPETDAGKVLLEHKGSMNLSESGLIRWLRKHNYNFLFRFTREILWNIAPWGRDDYWKWLNKINPNAIFYMVGENWFQDNLVLITAKKFRIPIILFNTEGYRLVNLKERHGIERLYYWIIKAKYLKLARLSKLVIYNCDAIKEYYARQYSVQCEEIVAYNSSVFDTSPYGGEHEDINIVYFGNLGVGRAYSIIEVADVLKEIDPKYKINVYGKPNEDDEKAFHAHSSIEFHGFVAPQHLSEIKDNADILLHVESFNPDIIPKLKYAFSTKIAQYLCAGRCILCYAPETIISTNYLKTNDCAVVAVNREELKLSLTKLLSDHKTRMWYANRALKIAMSNHNSQNTSSCVHSAIERVIV